MNVLICGSRYWNNAELMLERLNSIPIGSTLIHGGCRGADLLGSEIGRELGFHVVCFPANWNELGKAAGPIRNQMMINEGKPDLILAFHNQADSSRGTKDMLMRAAKHNIPFEIIKEIPSMQNP
jgi:YspA, cpYpsA-related SLOG family